MTQLRPFRIGLICAALWLVHSFVSAPAGNSGMSVAYAQGKGEAVRPEVGKPLQVAGELLRAQRFREALSKVAEADNVGNKTPYENYLIQRTRGSAAMGAGDNETAIRAFEATIASGRLAPGEQLKIVQAVAGLYYRANDYAKAASWGQRYFKEGGSDGQMRTTLIQAYYLNNDCGNVSRALHTDTGEEKNGRRASEEELKILSSCYLKQKDTGGYVATIEKLATYYPKKEYWTDLVNRIQRKPGFSDRLSLDVFRLKRATGNLATPGDYMEMTQLALQSSSPAEAKKVVDQGFSAGVLGTGADADRHKRLRELVLKTLADQQSTLPANEAEAVAAKDGTAQVNIGFNYVASGQSEKGLPMMDQGIRKGNLKRPEDAKLHLGVAYLLAGQKAKAIHTFKTVQGTDGTADLARLWVIQANRS